jgi:predicted metalloprotease
MRHGSTVPRPRRVLVALAVAGVLLSGCASVVTGSANPGTGEPADVPPDQFPIVGAEDGNAVDQGVRNALTDLYTFWGGAYPEFFGGDFQPLRGGVFSVDPDNVDPSAFPGGVGCGADPSEVENNAFYCLAPGKPHSDSISYDRSFLAELADTSGHALVPVVMAHEFGHAIQARFDFAGASINQETQADCFAGAWTRWVVDGNADHVAIRKPDLDDVIRGYLRVSDPVGRDPGSTEAHGSYFDRVSAIAEGYESGVGACRDNFGPDRLFTARPFRSVTDQQNRGNAPYGDTIDYTGQTLPAFWQSVFPGAFGKDFDAPALSSFDGTAPACVDGNRDLGYCASDHTVYYDETDLVEPAYSELGDFAVPTAISLPYALAARAQLGLSTDDGAATRSAVCLTGWYEAQIFNGKFPTLTISPGDVDEAVEFLLEYGVEDSVFPDTDATGFELLQQYRAGFLDGGSQCDIGIRG